MIWGKKTFADCSLVLPTDAMHASKFCGEIFQENLKIYENFFPWKLPLYIR